MASVPPNSSNTRNPAGKHPSGSDISDTPWVEKYRPNSGKTMIGAEHIFNALRQFLDEFFKMQEEYRQLKKDLQACFDLAAQEKMKLKIRSYQEKLKKHKAKILLGSPGVGKTTIVYALANDYGLSVIELNASDARTEDALMQKLQETVKSTNLLSFTSKKSSGKLILIDEVDGIHGQSDRGGVAALEKIIAFSQYPIIMTCNFRDDQKFGSLYELAAPIIEVPMVLEGNLEMMLARIVKAENLQVTHEQLMTIAKRCNGDFRSAINDLQGLSQGSGKIDDDALAAINMGRDTEANVQEFLTNLFKAPTIKAAKRVLDDVEQGDIDFRTIHRWINENLLSYLTKKYDLLYAFDNLAFVDRILGYILRIQEYSHLSYFFDILAGGIRLAKSDTVLGKGVIRSPRFFRLRAAPDDEIALRLQRLYRASLNDIMRSIRPGLGLFIKYNGDLADYLAQVLSQDSKKVGLILNKSTG